MKSYFLNKYPILPALKLTIISISMAVVLSCAYFNTVYNAKTYFHEGEKLVRHDTLSIDSDNFDKAIEKSTAIIVRYPDTRWIDDALFMMGASYYYKGDYSRAVEKLDFLVQNYPESGFYYEAQYLIGLANYKLEKYGSAVVALKEAMMSKKFKKKATIAMLYVYYQTPGSITRSKQPRQRQCFEEMLRRFKKWVRGRTACESSSRRSTG